MSRKQSRIGSRQQNENTILQQQQQQPKSPLVIKPDEQPPQVTVYTLGLIPTIMNESTHTDESTQTDELVDENTKPTSTVDTEESSMLLPISPPNTRQRESLKPQTVPSPARRYSSELPVHLPTIAPKTYPYKYMHARPNYYRSQHVYKLPARPLPPPPPLPLIHPRRQAFYPYNYGPTYDPRWWYMPVNSVHGPRTQHQQPQYLPPNQQYRPPKWYELPIR